MSIFNILTLMGGLALFLYGMSLMGDGLEKSSGGKLEKLLEKLTSNPIKAVFLGIAVTGVIQSSSATTVMVVGFVNSGIMNLSQAVGIIMGANIGTTVTSWILSLSGIESNNLFIQLLKPTSFSPVLAMIGIIFLLFMKSEKKKNIGMIMIGFAILMFGMDTMSEAVKPLAHVPEFTSILTAFSQPLLGLLAGALLTAVIQSSSASVGILQALCLTGSVSFGTAIPIIMGQNIGTCITAILSAIGANKNAKRAALIHLYFNLIGTSLFMIIFYSFNAFLKFSFLHSIANPAGIAIVHSLFNISATIVLLPFSKVLVKLAYISMPERVENSRDKDELQLLDARFLDKPSFAAEQCKNVAVNMAEITEKSLLKAIDLLKNYDKKIELEILEMENKVDRYEDELGSYLIKLSSKNLLEKDSKTLSILLHCIGDFERISDHSVNIMEAAKEMQEKDMRFSKNALAEIQVYSEAIKKIITTSIKAFITEDTKLASSVEPLEEVIDGLNEKLKERHIMRLRSGECTIELGFVLSDILNNYERVADHCSNIAVWILHSKENNFDTHEYLDRMKQSTNEEFKKQYNVYKKEYQLPYSVQ